MITSARCSYALRTTVVVALAIVSGCRAGRQDVSPTDRLDTFLRGAHSSTIDLDGVPTDTLTPLQTFGADQRDGGLFVGRSRSLEFFRDSIYIADFALDAVLVADRSFALTRVLGRTGDGPGEFVDPVDVRANERYLFVNDLGGRVQAIDDENAVFRIAATTRPDNIAASKSLLYVPRVGGDSLYDVYRASAPFNHIRSFLPRLISYGYQPGAFNSARIATGLRDGSSVVAYTGLPLLVRVDSSQQPLAVTHLEGAAVEAFDNPPLAAVRSSKPVMVRAFVHMINVFDDIVVFAHRDTVHLLRSEGIDLALFRKIVFLDTEGKTVPPQDVTVDGERIFVSSQFHPRIHVYEFRRGR